MPYIKKGDGRREALQKGELALNAGELNYQIFYYVKQVNKIADINSDWCWEDIKQFVDNFLGEKPNYQRYNDMTGALIRCEKEIERRLGIEDSTLERMMETYDEEIENYENTKIISNGDVE